MDPAPQLQTRVRLRWLLRCTLVSCGKSAGTYSVRMPDLECKGDQDTGIGQQKPSHDWSVSVYGNNRPCLSGTGGVAASQMMRPRNPHVYITFDVHSIEVNANCNRPKRREGKSREKTQEKSKSKSKRRARARAREGKKTENEIATSLDALKHSPVEY